MIPSWIPTQLWRDWPICYDIYDINEPGLSATAAKAYCAVVLLRLRYIYQVGGHLLMIVHECHRVSRSI